MTDSTNKNIQPEFGKKVRETVLTCKPNLQVDDYDCLEKVMTTKELADTLGVDVKTVNNTVERLLGNTFQKSEIKTRSNGGRPTKIFTEEQATLIKQEISKHHNLASRQIDAVSTDYEMELLTQKVLAYHIQKANEYKSRAEIAEQQLIEQQPKVAAYNNYLSRDKFCNFRDAANYLNIKQTDFMNLLKSKYIYKNSIGEYRAYSDYSDYFSLRPFERGKDKVGQQLMINIKGLEYFKKILAKEIIYA